MKNTLLLTFVFLVLFNSGVLYSESPFQSASAREAQMDIYSASTADMDNIRLDAFADEEFVPPKNSGYIIEFNSAPLVLKKAELETTAKSKKDISPKLEKYLKTLIKEREDVLKDLNRLLPSFNQKIRNSFFKVYNGVSADISAEEAALLKKSKFVKGVYPNYEVKALLEDSIPLINADDVWAMINATGSNYTGSGIKIAIIDTGIDYSHGDLGSCIDYGAVINESYGGNCNLTPEVVTFGEPETGRCEDLDGGINFCIFGFTPIWNLSSSGPSSTGGDYCDENGTLHELSCSEGGSLVETLFECPFGCDEMTGVCLTNVNINALNCSKVIGGYNFITNTNDPMDDMGHGTHCAGIAASTGNASGGVLKGVAPDASLLAYKVLDSSGMGWEDGIIGGIEMAMDPNQDNDTSDHADVLSLSLGGPFNEDSPMSLAVDNAVDGGAIVAVAAGNSYWYFTPSSPGNARKGIGVGAAYNNNNVGRSSKLRTTSPVSALFDSEAFDFSALTPDEGLEGEIAYAGEGFPEDFIGQNFSGKIALIKRSVSYNLTYQEKVQNAYNAGATGAMIFNYRPYLVPRGGSLVNYSQIPAVFISGNDGNYLLGLLESNGTARIRMRVYADIDKIAYFSSRGPVRINHTFSGNTDFTFYRIKPDVSAPGVKICSSQLQDAWSEYQCYDGEHTSISGTSMATPHVAGAVALIKQAHPDWSPTEIKHSLRRTAVDLGNDPMTQGYGRIDVQAAVLSGRPAIPRLDTLLSLGENRVNITGTAAGQNFHDYKLEIYGRENPEHIYSLTDYITTPVENGVLGVLDSSRLEEGEYYLKLTARNPQREESIDLMLLNIDKGIKSGWPAILQMNPTAAPAIADLDNDGDSEIVITGAGWNCENESDANFTVYVFNSDGTNAPGWPKIINTGNPFASGASLGDVDGDGEMEIFVSTTATNVGGTIYAWHYNGSDVEGWPMQFGPYFNLGFNAPAIADIDNDSVNEIITSAWEMYPYNILHAYVFEGNGSNSTGWPVVIPLDSTGAIMGNVMLGAPSIGDLDNDGYYEIVFSSEVSVYVLNHYGGASEFAPLDSAPSDRTMVFESGTPPVIGDIDGDGTMEIVISAQDAYSASTIRNNSIRIYNASGLENTIQIEGMRWYQWVTSPILSDIDNNGKLEIPYEDWLAIRVYEKNGSEFIQPVMNEWFYDVFSPIVGDVNGDSSKDIVSSGWFGAYAWDSKGKKISGWSKSPYRVYNSMAMADIEGDGLVEAVALSVQKDVWCDWPGGPFYQPDSKTAVYVWDLPSRYDPKLMDWPQYQHDAQHTGRFS